MYQYMRRDDWLRNYQYEDGIKKSFKWCSKRVNYSNNLELSFEIAKSSKILIMNLNYFTAIEKKKFQFFVN